MAVYAIVRVNVTDEGEYSKYAKLAGPAVAKYGGEFLARGGEYAIKEGKDWSRNVIIRFTDMATAQAFYHGPEYQEALAYGLAAADREYTFVEGI